MLRIILPVHTICPEGATHYLQGSEREDEVTFYKSKSIGAVGDHWFTWDWKRKEWVMVSHYKPNWIEPIPDQAAMAKELKFVNSDAKPKVSTVFCTEDSVALIMVWYGAFHAGDRYSVRYGDAVVKKDHNGEPVDWRSSSTKTESGYNG